MTTDRPSIKAVRENAGPGTLEAASSLIKSEGLRMEIPVVGRSMEPLLFQGDHVLVEPTRRPRTGNVVAFRRGSSLIVHRILSIRGNRCLEMGDASLATTIIDLGDILGLVIAVKDGGGDRYRLTGPLAALHAGVATALGRLALSLPKGCRRFVVLPARLLGSCVRRRLIGRLQRLIG